MDLSSYGVRDDANIDRSTAGVTGNRRGAGSSSGSSGCGCGWREDVDVLGRRVVGVDVVDGEYGGPWGVIVEEDELVVDVIPPLSSKSEPHESLFLANLLCIGRPFPRTQRRPLSAIKTRERHTDTTYPTCYASETASRPHYTERRNNSTRLDSAESGP